MDTHLNPAAQAIIDRHLKTMAQELEEADFQALGIVVGVLCDGQTSVSWCVKDDVIDKHGLPILVDTIVHDIVCDIVRATEE